MRVSDLMTSNAACVRPDTPVSLIAQKMKTENIGILPVCSDSGALLGIITDRDIVLRAVSAGQPQLTAQDIMTADPVSIMPDRNLHDACTLLAEHGVRRLPVVSGSRLIGMLSLGDIIKKPAFIDEAGDALSAICSSSTCGRTAGTESAPS